MTNSIIEDAMPRDYRKEQRIHYILRLHSHIPDTCPDCGEHLTVDDETIYCPNCGLVTQTSSNYTAGFKYHLPHGLRLG